MATVFIVNHSISGPYTESWHYFHKTEEEAAASFVECKQSASEDPNLIQLIALDTETLEATTYCEWSGTCFDLEEEEAELEAEGMADIPEDEDWVCEGAP